MRLAEPGWLTILLLIPVPWLFARRRPRVSWPSLGQFGGVPRSWAGWARLLPTILRTAALVCLAVAMARPQEVGGRTRVAGRGVAIMVALDHSSSMDEVDFPTESGAVSRLEAAKRTIDGFVVGRPDDLIGLVLFANYPDVACPPTLDHDFLRETARRVRSARPGDDGTNLGDAIAWSLDALREASPEKKVLILLTDGRNEPGVPRPLDPRAAAALARDLGVTLHTIAVGRPGEPMRLTERIVAGARHLPPAGPDLEMLADLARIGGGQSFVAADSDSLDEIFRTINVLEKSPVRGTIRTRYQERFAPWVGVAVVLLILDRLLANGRLRRLP